jgi:hypothetical protein
LLQHERLTPFWNASKLTVVELSLGGEVEVRSLPRLVQVARKGPEQSSEGEKMFVVFKACTRDAEEGLPGNKLKDKAAETPDVRGSIDGAEQN